MAQTRTGHFPIGFRRAWSAWQRDLPGVVQWAIQNDFSHMDFGPLPADDTKQVLNAGLKIACVDLPGWPELLSPDAGKRHEHVERAISYIKEMRAIGIELFMAVIVPEDPSRDRLSNFALAVESYAKLSEVAESIGAKIVLEGAPGKPPHFANFACTPADLRGLFREVHSDAIGINFDPSHLLRMGIDPVRFVEEFARRIWHVHAKDTELSAERLYDYGHLQAATFDPPRKYGGPHWRYVLPGRGVAPWGQLLRQLAQAGYAGRVSIELEDESYSATPDDEQRGLIEARQFLTSV